MSPLPWFRWHVGTVTDIKWPVIANRANTTMANVLAVWTCVLEAAAQSETRGSVDSWCAEDIAAHLGIELPIVDRIWDTMQGKVLTGNQITNWNRRQPIREDDSYERVKRYRERETISNAKKRTVTRRNAKKRQETPRVEESRVEEITTTTSAVGSSEDKPQKSKKPRTSVPKYPHFSDEVCKAGYQHWIRTHGAIDYARYRRALGPLFQGLPTDLTQKQLTDAQEAHKESVEEMDSKEAGFENIEKFAGRITNWLRLGAMPISDYGVLTERGLILGSKSIREKQKQLRVMA